MQPHLSIVFFILCVSQIFAGSNRYEFRVDRSLVVHENFVWSELGTIYDMHIRSDGSLHLGGLFDGGVISLKQEHWRNPIWYNDYDYFHGAGPKKGQYNYVGTSIILPDGDILLGGEWQEWEFENYPNLVRLNSDGTIDELFDMGSGPNGTVRDMVELSNGQILLAGSFTEYNGYPAQYVCRIWPDGQLDKSFQVGKGMDEPWFFSAENGYVSKILLLDNGKIALGGDFQLRVEGEFHDGPDTGNVAVIEFNGTPDPKFICYHIYGYVEALLEKPDGSLIVGSAYQGLTVLDAEGHDLHVQSPISSGEVNELAWLEREGFRFLLVGGDFNTHSPAQYFAVYLDLGDHFVNTTLFNGFTLNDWVGTIKVFPEGVVYLAGAFDEIVHRQIEGAFARYNTRVVRFCVADRFAEPNPIYDVFEEVVPYAYIEPFQSACSISEDQPVVHFSIHLDGATGGNPLFHNMEFIADIGFEYVHDWISFPANATTILSFPLEPNNVITDDMEISAVITSPLASSYYDPIFGTGLIIQQGSEQTESTLVDNDRRRHDWEELQLRTIPEYEDHYGDQDSGNHGVLNWKKVKLGWHPQRDFSLMQPRLTFKSIHGDRFPVVHFYVNNDVEPSDYVILMSSSNELEGLSEIYISDDHEASGWRSIIADQPLADEVPFFFKLDVE